MNAHTPAQNLLRHSTGLTVSRQAAGRAVKQRMALRGIQDEQAYLDGITPDELTQLVELVVVPESWLFRDAQAFYAAVEFVQQRVAAAGKDAMRPVRILSIPCAGGEEPYSMAMALRDANVPNQAFSIDAYDLSPGCVLRARSGVYGRNAFRAQDTSFRERYFTHLGEDEYRIIDSIREQITFRQGNLLQFDTRTYAGYYDLIFCRNLLIYFDKPTTKAAVAQLAALLNDDGMLFAGYAEVPSVCQHGFRSVPIRQAFALKKEMAPARISMAPAPAQPRARARTTQAPLGAPPPAAAAPGPVALAVSAGAGAGANSASASASASAPASTTAPRAGKAPAKPAPPETLLEQARRLADRGHFKDAAEKCHAHLAREPEAAEAYFILGVLSEHAHKMTAAEDYWRRCIYLQPDHYDALCHLALLAEKNGNQAGAANLKARAARIFQRQSAS